MTIRINAAESNRASIHYIPEASWGDTPASGVVKEMRITNSTLAASKQTKTSQELRADRMVSNIIETGAASAGTINFEQSAFSQDDFIAQFLLSSWSKAMTGLVLKGSIVTVSATNAVTILGGDYTDYIPSSGYIKLEGFLNPENNGYLPIDGASSYTGGNTVIPIDVSSLVVEAGSAYTKLFEAGDVIAYSSAITFESGNTISSNSANLFTGVVAGQKIYVEGLGKETGTITATATDPTAGDTFTISDGVDSITFEIHTSSSLVTPGNVYVAFSATEATLAASIAAAINAQFAKQAFRCSATVATAVVTVTNHRRTGGSITESSTGLTRVDFSGGSATKGGFYTVSSVPDTDTIIVAETLSADANSGTKPVLVKGSHIRNPGTVSDITKQSMSIETGFTDVNKYFKQSGIRVGEMKKKVQVGDIVTGSFQVSGGETLHRSTTYITGGSYTVLGTTNTEVMNATSNVGSVVKNGTALDAAVMSITLDGKNNLREQRAVGEKFPAGIGYGRFMLSGTIEVYFESFEFYDAFYDHETISLSYNFEDVDHNTVYETIPALKVTSDPIHPDGIDKDVMEKMSWEAQRDPALGTQFMVDRFSSVFPFAKA